MVRYLSVIGSNHLECRKLKRTFQLDRIEQLSDLECILVRKRYDKIDLLLRR